MSERRGAPPVRRPRLLAIGPLPRAGQAIGGTVVSFTQLTGLLGRSARFELEVLDTSRKHPRGGRVRNACSRAAVLARTLVRVLRRARSTDAVLLCMSSSAALRAGPLIQLAVALHGKPLGVRVFGGDLDLEYRNASPLVRWLARRTWMRSPLVLLQTRALCAAFADLPSVRWLPTTRERLAQPPRLRRTCRRFLFMAQLRPEKGIAEALAAIDAAPEGCTLTVCGPPMVGTDPESFRRHARVSYLGTLAPDQVPGTLAEHDALLFPSYHEGEGMPGAVLEALQSGLPVVAADWRAIGELVEHEITGLLVSPHSASELATAMTRLARDEALCARLSRGAAQRGAQYDAPEWHARLEDWLAALCGAVEPTGPDAPPRDPSHAVEPDACPPALPRPREHSVGAERT
jgi:glycosyltransferase involved in cell wall biosynthesis